MYLKKKMKKTRSVRPWYGHWQTGSKTWLKKNCLSDSDMVTGGLKMDWTKPCLSQPLMYYPWKFCFFFHLFLSNFYVLRVAGSPWEISVMTSGTVGPKMSVIGETVRLVPANHVAAFQISAIGFKRNDIRASVTSTFLILEFFEKHP